MPRGPAARPLSGASTSGRCSGSRPTTSGRSLTSPHSSSTVARTSGPSVARIPATAGNAVSSAPTSTRVAGPGAHCTPYDAEARAAAGADTSNGSPTRARAAQRLAGPAGSWRKKSRSSVHRSGTIRGAV